MVWSETPTHKQVTHAFDSIRETLDHAAGTVHCLVDLRLNPSFPLAATFNGALQLQSHKNMGKWLVIGGNSTARFIGRTIASAVHNNIEWLDTEKDAYRLLQSLLSWESCLRVS